MGLEIKRRTTEAAIRKAIHQTLIPLVVHGSPSRVLDEMSICAGDARIDIAVINGKLHGFEIKSEADTLERLTSQIAAYNRVFDTVTIVCGNKHLDGVKRITPVWWGIYLADTGNEDVELTNVRVGGINQNIDRTSLAQLLWKSELAQILGDVGLKKGIAQKPCRELWDLVSAAYSTTTLQNKVRELLKIRACWRLDLQQT